ncbi:uncharacterized protein LOC108665207 [Hyalella azteca]|uniref:Uncharacterized protein LOC108665207 n=1 Tax=Hyalella azteca TaxID=294128 RepID=A0A8B7N2J3_HYAAZ|nr:uncharacterized protein LOC108665207 [Hyalella azteca]
MEPGPDTMNFYLREFHRHRTVSKLKMASWWHEPEKPALTPIAVFKKEQEDLGVFKSEKRLSPTFRRLSDEEKDRLVARAQENLANYENFILAYVNSMRDFEKKVYVGFKREDLLRIFERDIFEAYPLEDYPILK